MKASRPNAAVASICGVLFVVVVLTFLPALSNGFVGYDDDSFVTANPQVRSGLTWAGILWAFRNPVVSLWHPVTMMSHMLDCQLYGLRPWGHHLTSVLVHALNTVLLFLLFRRMTGAVWRSALVAALFGLHPLRVESVAWVAERKDVLSALFWMLALLTYVRYAQQAPGQSASRKAAAWYLLSLTFLAVGLMCKPMLVALPFVLLLLDFWPLRRLRMVPLHGPQDLAIAPATPLRLVLEKLPFFALAVAAAVVTFLVQQHAGTLSTNLPLVERLGNAPIFYLRYLGMIFWPDNLSIFYPYPPARPAWQVAFAAAVCLAGLVAVVVLARKRPYLVVGGLWFCATLAPVIGVVQAGEQSIADRYTYLPSIGLLAALVWGAHDLFSHWRYRAAVLGPLVLAALCLCVAVTRQQISYWKDAESLFTHAIAVTRNNDLAEFNLGAALALKGDFEAAIPHYAEAVRIKPNKNDARQSLAYALTRTRRFAEAINQYEAALQLQPNDPITHSSLAGVYLATGALDKAVAHYTEAARLDPRDPQAQYELGVALASQGDSTNAARHLELSLELRPDSAPAQQSLGTLYRLQHRTAEALPHWRAAARLAPQWSDPLNNLAWVLATDARAELRNGAEAVALAARAVALAGTNNPTALDTLAAAYAEAGRFTDAVSTATAARAAALAQGQENLARQLDRRLGLYRSGQPYRESPEPN